MIVTAEQFVEPWSNTKGGQERANYAKHLPTTHEWLRFIMVCDAGNCFELYADFTGKGRHYNQFPDR
jgi:hypothetical protein